MDLFSEEYLAHYGVKGMKWGKHLPGVFPVFGNNRGTTTNYAGASRSTGSFRSPANTAGYSHASGTVKRIAEKRSGYTHATGTAPHSVEKSINRSRSSIAAPRSVEKSINYSHSSGRFKSANASRPSGTSLGVRVASTRPTTSAAAYTPRVHSSISPAPKVQVYPQKPSEKLTAYPQKPTKISDQTWGTTLKNLGSAVSQTGRKAAVSVLSLIQNISAKALRALNA